MVRYYTIAYRDKNNVRREIAGYPGESMTEALMLAIEEVPYLHENPNAVEHVIEEEHSSN